jgi:enoyl-[acyl-carrier protein] reductase II
VIACTALRNSSLQGGYLIMAARLLGLDCGPMSGFNAAAVDAAFWAGTAVRTHEPLPGPHRRPLPHRAGPDGLDRPHAAGQRRSRAPAGWASSKPRSGETANCQREITADGATGLPFGVNLPIRFLKDDAMLRFVCESGIRFVTTSAGSPAKFIAPLKAAGIVVYHAVPTLDAALKCVDAGVDGLVVEGAEGGGFKNPEEVSTLVLLQAIRERVDLPLVAAGGIVDGRGMAAAFALGAEAIQMGTRFVASAESPVHAHYKQAIVDADDHRHLGAEQEGHALHPRAEDRLHPAHARQRAAAADAFNGIQQVYFDGDMNAAPALAGQSAGLIHGVEAGAGHHRRTVAEFFAISQRHLGATGRRARLRLRQPMRRNCRATPPTRAARRLPSSRAFAAPGGSGTGRWRRWRTSSSLAGKPAMRCAGASRAPMATCSPPLACGSAGPTRPAARSRPVSRC